MAGFLSTPVSSGFGIAAATTLPIPLSTFVESVVSVFGFGVVSIGSGAVCLGCAVAGFAATSGCSSGFAAVGGIVAGLVTGTNSFGCIFTYVFPSFSKTVSLVCFLPNGSVNPPSVTFSTPLSICMPSAVILNTLFLALIM